MDNKIIYRIILDFIIAICILQAWWFVALPLALICLWRFPHFIEIIFAGIIYDALFGFVPEMGVWGYVGTIVSVILFMVTIFLKKAFRG